MKAAAILAALWAAYALAQGRNEADCQATCFQAIIDGPPYDLGCGNGNQTCLCSNVNFKNAVRDCAYATCLPDVVPRIVNTAERFCTDCKTICLDNIINSPPHDLMCSSGDTACLCNTENFKYAVHDCAYAACSQAVAPSFIKEVESLCAAAVTSMTSLGDVTYPSSSSVSRFSVSATTSSASRISHPNTALVSSSHLIPGFLPTPTLREPKTSGSIRTSKLPLPSGTYGRLGRFRTLNVSSVTSQISPSGELHVSSQNAIKEALAANETRSESIDAAEGLTIAARGEAATVLSTETANVLAAFLLSPECFLGNVLKAEIMFWMHFRLTSELRATMLAQFDVRVFNEIAVLLRNRPSLPVTVRTALHRFISKDDRITKSSTSAAALSMFVSGFSQDLLTSEAQYALTGWITGTNISSNGTAPVASGAFQDESDQGKTNGNVTTQMKTVTATVTSIVCPLNTGSAEK